MSALVWAGWVVLGVLVAVPLACVPAVHVYSVAAWALMVAERVGLAGDALAGFLLGLVTGWVVLGTAPALFFSVPDESLAAGLLPAHRYVFEGRGLVAAQMLVWGSLGGVVGVLGVVTAGLPLLRALAVVVRPHLSWILAVVVVFIVLSEWPRGGERGATVWARVVDAWAPLWVGWATFALAGALGVSLRYHGLLPVESGSQALLPVMLGLFAVPGLLITWVAPARVPPQEHVAGAALSVGQAVRGVVTGTAAGAFAAFFPLVTGGMAGLLAGHATAQRDERVFMVAQGAGRAAYFLGGYVLFFAPGLALTRGGLAWLLAGVYQPRGPEVFGWVVWGALLAAGVAGLVAWPVAWGVARVAWAWPARAGAVGTLVLVVGLVWGATGAAGVGVLLAATGIGLLPVVWGTRRMYGLGVLLVPALVDAAGWGAWVARVW